MKNDELKQAKKELEAFDSLLNKVWDDDTTDNDTLLYVKFFKAGLNTRTKQAEIERLKEERDSAIAFMNSNAQVISDQGYAIDKLEDKLSEAVEMVGMSLIQFRGLMPRHDKAIDAFLETLK